MDQIAAILLAAGRSRRMGKFKPLLPFGDQSVIESCVRNVQAAGIEETVVVAGHRAEDVREHLKSFNVSIAVNPDPDSAMSTSIAIGVHNVSNPAKAVLVALVDQPAVPSSVVTKLINEWRAGGARVIQPEYESRGGHPVLIDLVHREELMNLDPNRGLRAFFDVHRAEVRRVPVNCAYVARDMDTWEDYVRLHQEIFGRAPHDP